MHGAERRDQEMWAWEEQVGKLLKRVWERKGDGNGGNKQASGGLKRNPKVCSLQVPDTQSPAGLKPILKYVARGEPWLEGGIWGGRWPRSSLKPQVGWRPVKLGGQPGISGGGGGKHLGPYLLRSAVHPGGWGWQIRTRQWLGGHVALCGQT